ncbi:MAG: glutamine synthetase family protein [Deltaproteobacteria bacterium]
MLQFNLSAGRNKIAQYLNKNPKDFTKNDIVRYVEDNNIEFLNFNYVGEDSKLKTVNFIITDKEYLESILSTGERIDGSSIFSDIKAGKGDLYIIPRYHTAYVNPFEERPTVDMLCSFFTKDGLPLESAPENILRKAIMDFEQKTGLKFKAMGELEYYVIGKKDDMYPALNQKGYHSTAPFTKYDQLRREAMFLIAECGGEIKYGHSEVGSFYEGDLYYEQHEIEFLTVDPEKAVEELIIAKWILRMLGKKYGVTITFAPKILEGKAGSGLHIHMHLEKDDRNIMIDGEDMSNEARKMMAGILLHSKSLTAFGNTIPVSFLRLVKHQEAPTRICWGFSNRAALIRIPLGWVAHTNMLKTANPQQKDEIPYIHGKQTVEYRASDGSADLYHLVAGIIMAACEGLTDDKSLETAEKLFISSDDKKYTSEDLERFENLPGSCHETAYFLESERQFYEKDKIFPKRTIEKFLRKLRDYNDENLNEKIHAGNFNMHELIEKYLHTN